MYPPPLKKGKGGEGSELYMTIASINVCFTTAFFVEHVSYECLVKWLL